MVHAFEHLRRELDAVDLPIALDGRGVRERMVVRLEEFPGRGEEVEHPFFRVTTTRPRAEHDGPGAELHVGTKENAIGVRQDRAPDRGSFAPQLGHPSRGIDIEIRVIVEHLVHPIGIFGGVAEVHANDGGLR